MTFTVTAPDGAVAGKLAYSGVTATFTRLRSGLQHCFTATITTGVMMFQALRWRPIMCGPSRPLRPRRWSSPRFDDAATGVPIAQILSATFNEAMNCTTLASLRPRLWSPAPEPQRVRDSKLRGRHSNLYADADLAFNTVYTPPSQPPRRIRQARRWANYVWLFRTLPAPTATVISTVPINGRRLCRLTKLSVRLQRRDGCGHD